ncbi:4-hydroxyphenylpyruvate dioxygenase [Streptomyces sp. NPDC059785]|uniref:4-hydroxyphenylpyruvate dioxygenase n=1 Tax=unclassified Streptomyces TaxID=2593676 RepID=UPI003654C093
MESVFDHVVVDHVEWCTTDLAAAREWLETGYGFRPWDEESGDDADARRLGLCSGPDLDTVGRRGGIRVVLTQATAERHPAAHFTGRHGDGVRSVAFGVRDAAGAFAAAVGRGARPVAEPDTTGGVTRASIEAFGDVVHTFVERPAGVAHAADDGRLAKEPHTAPSPPLTSVDHIAVCLGPGGLSPVVDFYQKVLDFQLVFGERIVVAEQAMNSQVVRSACGGVTFTLIEPDTARQPGQIDAFLADNRGPGVQHLALTTADIVGTVRDLRANGVAFLSTPSTYYDDLARHLGPWHHAVGELEELDVLADEDSDGQLFQIFTRSRHPRGTFFLEIIERQGAKTFGSGNIKALYQAVEEERARARRTASGAPE